MARETDLAMVGHRYTHISQNDNFLHGNESSVKRIPNLILKLAASIVYA